MRSAFASKRGGEISIPTVHGDLGHKPVNAGMTDVGWETEWRLLGSWSGIAATHLPGSQQRERAFKPDIQLPINAILNRRIFRQLAS